MRKWRRTTAQVDRDRPPALATAIEGVHAHVDVPGPDVATRDRIT